MQITKAKILYALGLCSAAIAVYQFSEGRIPNGFVSIMFTSVFVISGVFNMGQRPSEHKQEL